jgi:hypothetical protein
MVPRYAARTYFETKLFGKRVKQIESAAPVSRPNSLKTYCLGLRFVAVVVVADAAGI